jgi:hypothetical protein
MTPKLADVTAGTGVIAWWLAHLAEINAVVQSVIGVLTIIALILTICIKTRNLWNKK